MTKPREINYFKIKNQ